MPTDRLSIGALAESAGLPVKTVRYYSDIGLLPEAERSQGGYRLFTETDLRRLKLIRQARLLQIPLAEVRRLLHLAFDRSCVSFERALREVVAQRLIEVEVAISELEQLRRTLSSWPQAAASSDSEEYTAAECESCSLIDT